MRRFFGLFLGAVWVWAGSVAIAQDRAVKSVPSTQPIVSPSAEAAKTEAAFIAAVKAKDAKAMEKLIYFPREEDREKLTELLPQIYRGFERDGGWTVYASAESGDLACVLVTAEKSGPGMDFRLKPPAELVKQQGAFKVIVFPCPERERASEVFGAWVQSKMRAYMREQLK